MYIIRNLLIIFLILISISVFGQSKFKSAIGGGINLSKFYLEKIDIPYPDPMSTNIGYVFRGNFSYSFNNKYALNIELGYSYMDSKAKKTNNRISHYFDVPLYASYHLNDKIEFNFGLIYQRLKKFLIGGWGNTADLTSITTNRHFLNPYFGISYKISKNLMLKSEIVYTIKDTYLASTADYNGVDTPPLKAKRHFASILLYYKIGLKKNRKHRKIR